MDRIHISDSNEATMPEAYQDLDLHDFITDETSFDQILELMGEEIADPVAHFDSGYVDIVGQQLMIQEEVDCLMNVEIESQFLEHGLTVAPQDVGLVEFGNGNNNVVDASEDHRHFNQFMDESMPQIDVFGVVNRPGDLEEEEEEDDDEDMDGNVSSGTTTTTTTTTPKKGKADRSRTLVSERRRRGRMKENLYALRAMVPNITKMDKASIVGDAVLYVQKLQVRAKRLKAEIADLEASTATQLGSTAKPRKSQVATSNSIITPVPIAASLYIMKMDVFQVGEREFYIKLVSNKGEGIPTRLHKAIESLDGVNVQSSKLSAVVDNFVFSVTMEVREGERDVNMPNLKPWLSGALTSQGFLLELSP